jgi:hypothetical protein
MGDRLKPQKYKLAGLKRNYNRKQRQGMLTRLSLNNLEIRKYVLSAIVATEITHTLVHVQRWERPVTSVISKIILQQYVGQNSDGIPKEKMENRLDKITKPGSNSQ